MSDSLWEPPEVQELLDEMGNPGIPLSVISKATEMQLLYAVDKESSFCSEGGHLSQPTVLPTLKWKMIAYQMEDSPRECIKQNLPPNLFLPKITMVGISTGEAGQMSKASLKKTMEDLTKELEQTEQGNAIVSNINEIKIEDRDPLFVANVGDYYSGMANIGSAQWIRGRNI
ncbi:hypothetical protein FH972_002216 [Carpinus fangiana]|uniref:Uncharacterized protein n=1 Tax=Carpinus fangiana TaxID=176857 RepID=A0A5N6QEJ3_9ROSI|nr:hypothetical protein FH972_002216 [Carpinus fangiana]